MDLDGWSWQWFTLVMVVDSSYMLAFGLSVPTARLAIASQAKTVQLPVQASAHWVEAPRGLADPSLAVTM